MPLLLTIYLPSLTMLTLRELCCTPLKLFKGRQVGPNSIFCDEHRSETTNGCVVADHRGPKEWI
jgi:hypothetical protein